MRKADLKHTTAGVLFLSAIVLLVGYYIFFPSKGSFNSDTADTIMWAKAMVDSGKLINPNFSYACFLPFGGQILMAPLVAIFGVGMTAQTLGMLLFFACFTAALLFMLRQMEVSASAACFITGSLLLLLCGSEKLREIFYEHVIYYSLGVLFAFVGLGLAFKLLRYGERAGSRSRRIITMVILCIWCALTAMNQFESLVLFLFPFVGALTAERFFNYKEKISDDEKNKQIIFIGLLVLSAAIGYLLGAILTSGQSALYASSYSCFSPPEKWVGNLFELVPNWITLIGAQVNEFMHMGSLGGMAALLYIGSSFVLIILPVVATCFYKRLDRRFRILICYHWLLTALILAGCVFGILTSANWRLSPLVCTSAVITFLFLQYVYPRVTVKRFLVLPFIPLVLSMAITASSVFMLSPSIETNSMYQTMSEIKSAGLTYGYATFWNANVLTVLSDDKIRVRGVEFDKEKDRLIPQTYQSNKHWYEKQPSVEKYFLLLKDDEYEDLIDFDISKSLPIDEVRSLTSGFYLIILNDNIF